jgi:hypothetical protein
MQGTIIKIKELKAIGWKFTNKLFAGNQIWRNKDDLLMWDEISQEVIYHFHKIIKPS